MRAQTHKGEKEEHRYALHPLTLYHHPTWALFYRSVGFVVLEMMLID